MGEYTCPNCHHQFQTTPQPQFKKVCADCKQPIRLHHKYYLAVENGSTVMRHRHCDAPESYRGVA